MNESHKLSELIDLGVCLSFHSYRFWGSRGVDKLLPGRNWSPGLTVGQIGGRKQGKCLPVLLTSRKECSQHLDAC